MVERGKFAGDMVRLIIAGGCSRDEPDMCCDRGERRQQGHRIEIGHVLRPALKRAELAVTHRNRIRDKHQVELTALRYLSDLSVMLKVGAGIDLRIGMQPGSDMVAGWVKKRPEMQFFAAAVVAHDLL